MTLVRRATEWAFATALSIPFGLLYSVILARGLGPDARGDYAVFVTVVGVLAGILALGLGVVGRADVASDPPKAATVHSYMVWYLVAVGIALQTAVSVMPGLLPDKVAPWATAVVLCTVAALYSGFGTMLLQGSGRFRVVNVLRVVRTLLDVIAISLVLIVLRLGLSGAILGWSIAGVLVAALTFLAIVDQTKAPRRPDVGEFIRAVRHGWKILFAGQAVALQIALVVLLLNHFGTSAEVGVFAIAVGLSSQVAAFWSTLAVISSDRIAGSERGISEDLVKRIARLTVAMTPPLVLVAAVLSGVLIRFLYGREFSDAAMLFTVLLAGTLISQVTEVHAQYLIGQHWKSRDAMLLNMGNLVVCLVAAFVLIPRFHALGAASTLTISYFVNAAVHHVWVAKIMGCRRRELLLLTGADLRRMVSIFNLFPKTSAP